MNKLVKFLLASAAMTETPSPWLDNPQMGGTRHTPNPNRKAITRKKKFTKASRRRNRK